MAEMGGEVIKIVCGDRQWARNALAGLLCIQELF